MGKSKHFLQRQRQRESVSNARDARLTSQEAARGLSQLTGSQGGAGAVRCFQRIYCRLAQLTRL